MSLKDVWKQGGATDKLSSSFTFSNNTFEFQWSPLTLQYGFSNKAKLPLYLHNDMWRMRKANNVQPD